MDIHKKIYDHNKNYNALCLGGIFLTVCGKKDLFIYVFGGRVLAGTFWWGLFGGAHWWDFLLRWLCCGFSSPLRGVWMVTTENLL